MSNPTAVNPTDSDRGFFGHPRGLSTLFFTEMWERFSFYGLRPLLVLFMSAAIFEGGFGFNRSEASAIVGIYAACVYLSSLPGGWIADKLLGLQRAILWGAILISAGHIAIGVSAFAAGKSAFFLGLLLIVLGTGLLKPNISAIVGDLYPEDSPRRDSGFSIFYMGINIGAFAGQLVTGFLGEIYGWHYGFGAAGVGMLAGLLVFAWKAKATLGNIGLEPTKDPDPVKQKKTENLAKVFITSSSAIIALVFILAASGFVILDPVAIGGYMVFVLMGLAFLFFVYVLGFAGLTSVRQGLHRAGHHGFHHSRNLVPIGQLGVHNPFGPGVRSPLDMARIPKQGSVESCEIFGRLASHICGIRDHALRREHNRRWQRDRRHHNQGFRMVVDLELLLPDGG